MTMFPQDRVLEYGHDDTASRVKLKFFHMVYLWMSIGLMLTAVVSFAVAHYAPQLMMMGQGVVVMLLLGLFALAWGTQHVALKVSAGAGLAMFMLYASLIGLLISYIWVVYSMELIGLAFLVTGGVFLMMSIIGFVTRADLSRMGAILGLCAMGLFGVSIMNVFMGSDMLSWAITWGVVIVFTGLLAYQTQMLNEFAEQAGHDPVLAPRMAVVGSLLLYIAFINLFMAILRILGSRK